MSASELRASDASSPVNRSVAQVFLGAIVVSVFLGVLIGFGLAVDLTLRNGESLNTDTLILGGYLTALYGSITSLGLSGAAVAMLILGRRPDTRFFLALSICFYVFLNSALRFNPVIQPASVVPHLTWVGLLDFFTIMIAITLIGWGIMDRVVRRSLAKVGIGVVVLAGLWFVNALNERPLRRDLGEIVPAALAVTERAAIRPAADTFQNTRLIVLGFDGLSWEVVVPLLRRGEMPGFASLLEGANYGYLDTLPFTISPVVWETISTGQDPSRHGIGYHGHFEFPGMSWRVRRLPAFPLASSPMGLRRLLVALSTRGAPWAQVIAASNDAKVARLWEIASGAGISVGIYDWLNTEPATPISGFSRGLYRSLAPFDFPIDLEGNYVAPHLRPKTPTQLDPFETSRSHEFDIYEHFVDLAVDVSPEVLLFYTHFGDSSNHLNWKAETYGEQFFLSGLSHPDVNPGSRIASAHRLLDEILSDVLTRVTEDTMVVIVSDHGFDYRGYEHDNGPAGVWISRGPELLSGAIDGVSVFDVTPTLLHALDLPVADDMQGEVMPIAAPGGRLDRIADRVPSYGPAASSLAAEVDDEGLEKHLEYLRSLGYVN